jgi:hypothetical protein
MVEMPSEELAEVYGRRLQAELEAADIELPGADAVRGSGRPSASVLLVKGEPGPAEIGGGVALSGADGDAIDKALEALGRDPRDRYAVVSRPVAGVSDDRVKRRLRRIIEACDPVWVVALDPDAAHDVFHALGRPELGPGTVTRLMGRSVLALEGLEASLEDEALKRRVWAHLKALRTE